MKNVQSRNYGTINSSSDESNLSVYPKRSKTIVPNIININDLKRENINFYKHLISDISYALVSFSNYNKRTYTSYNRFFIIIFKILNKYSKKKNKNNKLITKLIVLNLSSYEIFIISICKNFNDTIDAFKNASNSTELSNIKIKKIKKRLLKEFHMNVQDEFLNLNLIAYEKIVL